MKRSASRKRLAMWGALPPYLGGKRRLCPLIFREIDRVLPRRLWAGKTLVDGFMGGGSVSLYAKAMGFKVVSCDIADRAIVVGRGLIENSRVKLTREDILRMLTPNPEPAMRVEREMVPAIFTANVARLIDRALAQASVTTDPAKTALLRMLAIRVALLEHPMSQVRKGTIHRVATGEFESITESCVHHYVGGLRLTRTDRVWALAQQINGGVFQGEGVVHQGSVLDLLPSIEADVAYFDPPYPGVMSYEKEYKVIDEILEGTTRPTSPFTAKDGAALIDGLFERALHIPIWLLSLGNAVASLAELEEKMTRLGRATRAIEIKYQHLPSIATEEKRDTNREYLVVGWDPAAPHFAELPLGSGREEVVRAGAQDPGLLGDADGLRTQGAPAPRFLDDAEDHRALGLVDQSCAGIGVARLPVHQGDLHEPLPLDIERSVNERDEPLGTATKPHSRSVSPFPSEVN